MSGQFECFIPRFHHLLLSRLPCWMTTASLHKVTAMIGIVGALIPKWPYISAAGFHDSDWNPEFMMCWLCHHSFFFLKESQGILMTPELLGIIFSCSNQTWQGGDFSVDDFPQEKPAFFVTGHWNQRGTFDCHLGSILSIISVSGPINHPIFKHHSSTINNHQAHVNPQLLLSPH